MSADEQSAADVEYWPFPETDKDDPLGDKDFWAGITWHSDDQYQGRYLIRCRTKDTPGSTRPFEQRFFPLVESRIEPASGHKPAS